MRELNSQDDYHAADVMGAIAEECRRMHSLTSDLEALKRVDLARLGEAAAAMADATISAAVSLQSFRNLAPQRFTEKARDHRRKHKAKRKASRKARRVARCR